ncbi:MAG: Crp/Fnr family transcriptional regulator [Thermodesulfobacteriota bacterium]
MKNLDQLSQIPLFSKLSDQDLQALAGITKVLELKRRQQIFNEGDEARGLYIVSEGQVKVYKLSFDGKEQILHLLGPGEPFAEVAVFAGTTYPANSMALEKSRVLFLPRQDFHELIGRQPSLALAMLATLSLRLRQFANMIEALSLKEVPSRLAVHLLLLSEESGGSPTIRLAMAKGQLASLLGTIPETLSRILAKLASNGYIESSGKEITIRDRAGLEALAEGVERL